MVEEIRSACISTFGYKADSSIFHSDSCNGPVLEYARQLLESLLEHRRKGHEDVPIIFIAHGIGGHICEQALLLCHETVELRDLRSSTSGVIFLDTPHSGDPLIKPVLAFEKYFNGLHLNIWQDVLRSMPVKSEFFADLEAEFGRLRRDTQDHIKTADWVGSSYVEKSNSPVSQGLALIPTVDTSSQLRKHANMASFARSEDEGFQFVLRNVRRWMYTK
jgi:hypothetical protein